MSFNVAAGRSPRKCGTRQPRNSACRWLQCGRGPKPTEMRPLISGMAILIYASMWPRAEAHGNSIPFSFRTSRTLLQCGRGPKPTEILLGVQVERAARRFNVAAGRSPRKFNKGWVGPSPLMGFNVAAGRSPRKSGSYSGSCNAHRSLQCGRGPKPTEMIRRSASSMGRTGASMWPRAEAHGNYMGRWGRDTRSRCFNVAAGRSPRKYDPNRNVPEFRIASMWPRAEAHGNAAS